MKNNIKTLLSAIMAGALIAIAGTTYLYLMTDYKIIGAFLFGFGLLCVVTLDYKLYTGRIGYLIDHDKTYIFEILIIIFGNILGGLLIGSIIYLSNYEIIINTAKLLVETKLSKNLLEIFGLSMLCGMMMYLGVDGYKRINNSVAKVVVNMFAVVIFVLLGFEHSIANVYYFILAHNYSWYMLLSFVIMLIGNGVGAILLNTIEKFGHLKKSNE